METELAHPRPSRAQRPSHVSGESYRTANIQPGRKPRCACLGISSAETGYIHRYNTLSRSVTLSLGTRGRHPCRAFPGRGQTCLSGQLQEEVVSRTSLTFLGLNSTDSCSLSLLWSGSIPCPFRVSHTVWMGHWHSSASWHITAAERG